MNDTIETSGIFAISGLPRRCWINVRQRFSGTVEWNFMKLLPNDSGKNGVSIAVYGVFNWKPFLHYESFVYCAMLCSSAVICTADALKRHERVNVFNLVIKLFINDQ